jgi:hypothetical protein
MLISRAWKNQTGCYLMSSTVVKNITSIWAWVCMWLSPRWRRSKITRSHTTMLAIYWFQVTYFHTLPFLFLFPMRCNDLRTLGVLKRLKPSPSPLAEPQHLGHWQNPWSAAEYSAWYHAGRLTYVQPFWLYITMGCIHQNFKAAYQLNKNRRQ